MASPESQNSEPIIFIIVIVAFVLVAVCTVGYCWYYSIDHETYRPRGKYRPGTTRRVQKKEVLRGSICLSDAESKDLGSNRGDKGVDLETGRASGSRASTPSDSADSGNNFTHHSLPLEAKRSQGIEDQQNYQELQKDGLASSGETNAGGASVGVLAFTYSGIDNSNKERHHDDNRHRRHDHNPQQNDQTNSTSNGRKLDRGWPWTSPRVVVGRVSTEDEEEERERSARREREEAVKLLEAQRNQQQVPQYHLEPLDPSSRTTHTSDAPKDSVRAGRHRSIGN